MNLIDGYIIYPQLSVNEFKTEITTWTTPGLYGVICDDATSAISSIGPIGITIGNVGK